MKRVPLGNIFILFLLQASLALLADKGQTGGLHGLVERFQEAGLGNVISSPPPCPL